MFWPECCALNSISLLTELWKSRSASIYKDVAPDGAGIFAFARLQKAPSGAPSLRGAAVLPGNQFQNSEVQRFRTLALGDFRDDYLPSERADFRRQTRRFVWADRIELGVPHPDLQFIRAGGNVWQAKGTVAVTKGAEASLG